MLKPSMSGEKSKVPLSYKSAGVNIYQADEFVRRIAPLARRTYTPNVLGHLGASAGLFRMGIDSLREPVLVASADGVGSKILLAEAMNRYDTLGFDLVAMNVNDLLTTGARPLFFMDYLAVGRLDLRRCTELIRGIAEACREAGCVLLGGETAEMPLVYSRESFDLAGFVVGVTDRSRLLWRSRVKSGDTLIGLASSGLHSNGYSLALKVAGWPSKAFHVSRSTFHVPKLKTQVPGGGLLGETLLRPTRIYTQPVLAALKSMDVHAIAHITGGGLLRNLARILPKGLAAHVRTGRWPVPPIFPWIARQGPVNEKEMFRTFNMGIGLVMVVPASASAEALKFFRNRKVSAYDIGRVVPLKGGPRVRFE